MDMRTNGKEVPEGHRSCDTCGRIQSHDEGGPDWPNGSCEVCDPQGHEACEPQDHRFTMDVVLFVDAPDADAARALIVADLQRLKLRLDDEAEPGSPASITWVTETNLEHFVEDCCQTADAAA